MANEIEDSSIKIQLEMRDPRHERIHTKLAPMRAATLALAFVPPENVTNASSGVFTGFGVEVKDIVYWVTADHVVEELDRAINLLPDLRLFIMGMNSPAEPVPFRWQLNSSIRVGAQLKRLWSEGELQLSGDPLNVDELWCMDVAAVPLADIHVQALMAVGFRPLTIDNLCLPTKEEVDEFNELDGEREFFVHGAIEASVHVDVRMRDFSYDWKTLPLEAEDWTQPKFSFRPLWRPSHHDAEIKGMSGGPVVMTGFNPLRVVAVQSSQFGVEGRMPSQLFAWDIQFLLQVLIALSSSTEFRA